MGPPIELKPLRRCLESLSQKLKVPSLPAVENVPYSGWKEIALTACTWFCSRWHLKEKLDLLISIRTIYKGQ
jgi:hypothetical protein